MKCNLVIADRYCSANRIKGMGKSTSEPFLYFFVIELSGFSLLVTESCAAVLV